MDIELLQKAGAKGDLHNGIIIKFISPETEAALYKLELDKAQGKKVKSTKYGILKQGNGYRFFVIEQTYKN